MVQADYNQQMLNKRLSILLFTLILPLGLLITIWPQPTQAHPINPPAPPNHHKLDDALAEALQSSQPNTPQRILIHVTNPTVASPAPLPPHTDPVARRTALIQQLKQTALANQANLRQTLQRNPAIQHIHPFWIVNAIAATATPKAILSLVQHPDVAQISLDVGFQLDTPIQYNETAVDKVQTVNGLDPTLLWGINRIQAPYSWHGLGVDGQGTTVAIMDSGVTWQHPSLLPNYRGNLGNNTYQHIGNWYDASDRTEIEPFDDNGHGTHVAGTAVGQNGIGVAPGAQWIAVKIGDENGTIFNEYLFTAFEWLMAPNDDPALAPDVVNGSWSNHPTVTFYQTAIDHLHQAGIITVFAVGNSGPGPSTAETPANYTDTLAIGASDDIDQVTWFSSRGPSYLTGRIAPNLVAPGTHILSTWLNNEYAYLLGTSMATPHVAGAVALILSANPTLSRLDVSHTLTNTAVAIAPSHPNNNSGWGRLNAYAAVAQHTPHGTLRGTVQANSLPLNNATLTITTPTGDPLIYHTDANGQYAAQLQPGIYTVAATQFGHQTAQFNTIIVTNGQNTFLNITLTPQPTGILQGTITDAVTGMPITATITLLNTPITAVTTANGQYSLPLPAGSYDLLVSASHHRLGQANHAIIVGQTTTANFTLDQGPDILLIDGGQWYYDTYRTHYEEALLDLGYRYHSWPIRNPSVDVPNSDQLAAYDVTIWSDPRSSPGAVVANTTITGYLDNGGNMLLSGQNIASLDGNGFTTQLWWLRKMGAYVLDEAAITSTITGTTNTTFSQSDFTLNGGTSANNQQLPDQLTPAGDSLTQPILAYQGAAAAGLQAGQCTNHRLVLFAFGLEGVTDATDRTQLLQSSIDYFESPRLTNGVRWLLNDVDDFALPGETLTYTLMLQNLSETVTDTFTLDIDSTDWATTLMTPTLTLGPCQKGQAILTINIPPDAAKNTQHNLTITAVSQNNLATTDQRHFQHKIPGYILLVDDDRWYERQPNFTTALDQTTTAYDIWNIGWAQAGREGRGSPPAKLLQAYDIVIWFTGYDWLSPITPAEHDALYAYMAQGGRLFLTSQDYLYYHPHDPLTQDFIGALSFQESVTPTQLYAGNTAVLPPTLAGPLPLTYTPYQNFSDGIWPKSNVTPYLWHNQGMIAATNHQGVAANNRDWRLNFWAVPFETLPETAQATAMNATVGWLSDLGESTFVASQRTITLETPLYYTITIRNLNSAPTNTIWLTNTLPTGLQLLPHSVEGAATYDTQQHQLIWQGQLAGGTHHQIRYAVLATDTLTAGTQLDNHLTLHYQRHHLHFERVVATWVEAPDLSDSSLNLTLPTPQATTLTYTLSLHNSGLAASDITTAVLRLPTPLFPLTQTVQSSQGTASINKDTLTWAGSIEPDQTVTVSLILTRTLTPEPMRLSATAVLDDNITVPILREHRQLLTPYRFFFPFIADS